MQRDLASGLVLAGIGILITVYGRTLSYRDEFGPGPGFLPQWLGVILTALALGLIVSTVRFRSGTSKNNGAGGSLGRALMAAFGVVMMVLMMEVLGFIVSFAFLTFFLVYGIERRSLAGALTVALGMSLAFFLLFRFILPVPLPTGLWGL